MLFKVWQAFLSFTSGEKVVKNQFTEKLAATTNFYFDSTVKNLWDVVNNSWPKILAAAEQYKTSNVEDSHANNVDNASVHGLFAIV